MANVAKHLNSVVECVPNARSRLCQMDTQITTTEQDYNKARCSPVTKRGIHRSLSKAHQIQYMY